MKAGSLITLMAVLLAASGPLAAAQLYQWKDAQGRMVYSDQQPPAQVRNAQQKSFKGNVIEVGDSYALKTAREQYPVVLYASACGIPCEQARKLLIDRGIPFSNKDPQATPATQTELLKLTGRSNVPVIVVGADMVDGFEAGQWNAALDRAGYPKTAAPVRQSAAAPEPVTPPASSPTP